MVDQSGRVDQTTHPPMHRSYVASGRCIGPDASAVGQNGDKPLELANEARTRTPRAHAFTHTGMSELLSSSVLVQSATLGKLCCHRTGL